MSLLSDIGEIVYPTISKEFRQQGGMCICVEWKSCQLDLYFAKGCFEAKTFFSLCGLWRKQKLTFHSPQYVTKFKLISFAKNIFLFFISFVSVKSLFYSSLKIIIPICVLVFNFQLSSKKLSKFNFGHKSTIVWWTFL